MVDCFNRLRHDTVICGDNQNREVGNLRAAGTHSGERLVARGIQEGDESFTIFAWNTNLVGTNVLGDAAVLTGNNVRVPDGIEQPCLSVVNVAHDSDNRGPWLQILRIFKLFSAEVDVKGLK